MLDHRVDFPEAEQESVYMVLDGIAGEVTVKGFEDSVAVRQFSYGVSLPLTMERTRGGATRDKSVHSQVSIIKVADLSSVKLYQHCCEGTSIASVVFNFIRFSQGELVISRTLELTDCFVGQFHHMGASGLSSDLPLEEIHFDFATIKDTYTQQLPDGSAGGNVEFGWDRLNGTSA
jgi:type VI secretion system secreted protein Hcp